MSNAVPTTGILVKRRAGTVNIIGSSVANPSIVSTRTPHGFVSGQSATIAGSTGSTPDVNGAHVVTVIDATHLSIPVNVTVPGVGGTLAPTSATYTTIAEITKVSPPGYSRNKIETSTHNDGSESYILGILRQKDPNFDINYLADDATHELILDDILNNVKNDWQFAFPSGVLFSGPARVQNFQIADAPVDGAQQANIALAWAGPVTQS